MKKLGTGIVAALSVVVLWAPAALAATPEEIYSDLADNGRLDGTYTKAEMDAFLQSPAVQGYGNPTVVVVPPTVTPPTVTPPTPQVTPLATPPVVTPPVVAPVVETPAAAPAPASVVAGVSKTVKPKPAAQAKPVARVAGVATPAQQAPLARTASAETLPFTGAELGLFALVGAALLLGGLLLRASARQR